MEIGTRVRLTQDVDNYTTGLIRSGETGTLTRITDEGTYWGKLDKHHSELAEWDNERIVNPPSGTVVALRR